MISINGIGWIDKEEYGCVLSKRKEAYKDSVFPKKEIFSFPYKNFGRLDHVSRLTCAAVALALNDAGIKCVPELRHDAGIVSTNASGSFESDMLYFRDYLESGRTLSRGNLFIYTLPSSPSGEAAIYFGLQGPLLYISGRANPMAAALTTASEMVINGDASVMLAGMNEEDAAIYLVLGKTSGPEQDILFSYDRAVTIFNKGLVFKKMIEEFAN